MASNEEIETLMARVDLGDRHAFKTLHSLVAGQLMAVAMRIVKDQGAAEDVVQDVFVGFWNKASDLNTPTRKTLGWLCVVTRNRALDLIRRRPAEVPLQWTNSDGEEAFHDVASDNPGIFEQLQAEQDNRRLQDCLQQLEPTPRKAILLAYCEGLTHIELATRLESPLGTIKAWTRRSLMQLRNCMGVAI